MEVVRINKSIASISFFRINVLLSSKDVGLGSELIKVETDNKVELGQIFRPSYLLINKNFSSQKIFEVFVFCDNIDRKNRTFQIVSLDLECFKNSEEFLIINIIVKLSRICHKLHSACISTTSRLSFTN